MFSGEEEAGSAKVWDKSHRHKVILISAVSCSDSSRDFDGKIEIWQVCVMKHAQRTTAQHMKGEEHESDVIIDAEYYQQ